MYLYGKNLKDGKFIIYLMDDNGRPKYCSIFDYHLDDDIHNINICENKEDNFIMNCY